MYVGHSYYGSVGTFTSTSGVMTVPTLVEIYSNKTPFHHANGTIKISPASTSIVYLKGSSITFGNLIFDTDQGETISTVNVSVDEKFTQLDGSCAGSTVSVLNDLDYGLNADGGSCPRRLWYPAANTYILTSIKNHH